MVDFKRHGKRLFIGISLASFFLLLVSFGHFYTLIFSICCALGMSYELFTLKNITEQNSTKPLFRIQGWYFFTAYLYTFYGFILKAPLANTDLGWVFKNHKITAFSLFFIGIIAFTLTLKQGNYKKQFSLLGWTHLTCLVIVGSTACVVSNLFKGTIWYIYPITLVTLNDAFAYAFGVAFGKTKLIRLSPNKTWEGYFGGYVATCISGIIIAAILPYVEPLTCIPNEIAFYPYDFSKCIQNPNFVEVIDNGLQCIEIHKEIDFLIHAYIFCLFAAILAPFGGFFASGFKRALNIKDFGSLLPGHGGLTDRFDCTLMNSVFVWAYTEQFAKVISLQKVLDLAKKLCHSQLVLLIPKLQMLLNSTQATP